MKYLRKIHISCSGESSEQLIYVYSKQGEPNVFDTTYEKEVFTAKIASPIHHPNFRTLERESTFDAVRVDFKDSDKEPYYRVLSGKF